MHLRVSVFPSIGTHPFDEERTGFAPVAEIGSFVALTQKLVRETRCLFASRLVLSIEFVRSRFLRKKRETRRIHDRQRRIVCTRRVPEQALGAAVDRGAVVTSQLRQPRSGNRYAPKSVRAAESGPF